MTSNSFDLPMDVLRARQNAKWQKYGPAVLPAWVADMDFAIAHPIRRAMERIIADQDYGYADRPDGGAEGYLAKAFQGRMQDRFGWQIDTDLVQPLADLVQGTFSAIWSLTEPGDGVILQLPAYPPFHDAIHSTGRTLIPLAMRDNGARFVMDLAELDRLAAVPTTRMILLCNPQNPTGRVFERAELEAIGRAAIANDLIILSDEIHADLMYDGAKHIPIASLSPAIAARTITINSPTKSFNIPGLRCGVMYFGSAELRDRFHRRVPRKVLGSPGITGIDATVAAWNAGQPWLDEVVAHLQAMRNRVFDTLAREMPAITYRKPEATYLGWLDCSQLPIAGTAFDFFHDRAKIAFSAGETFDPAAAKFVRFNFATSERIVDRILERMIAAVRQSNAPAT